MEITKGKIAAAVVAMIVITILFALDVEGSLIAAKGCIWVAIGLLLITFPDALGSFKGYVGRGGNIDTESPPFLVITLGWFFVIGMPAILVALR